MSECLICFNEIQKNQNIILCLSCDIPIHQSCYKQWWKKNPKDRMICVHCRQEDVLFIKKGPSITSRCCQYISSCLSNKIDYK